jgi:hypothetical protein
MRLPQLGGFERTVRRRVTDKQRGHCRERLSRVQNKKEEAVSIIDEN